MAAPSAEQHKSIEIECARYKDFINSVLGGDQQLRDKLPLQAPLDILPACVDGVLLSKLINVAKPGTLNEKQLAYNIDVSQLNVPGSRAIFEMTANHNLCIDAARSIGCKIVNISAADVMAQKPDLVLGLVWQIIRVILLKDLNLVSHPELIRLLEKGEALDLLLNLPPEQLLQRWFNYHLRRAKHTRVVKNFSTDVQDGENYLILLRQIAPKLVDHELIQNALASEAGSERVSAVVATAAQLGCRDFITPAIISSGNPRLNLAFTATLFNSNIGIQLPSEAEVAELYDTIASLKQEIAVWQGTVQGKDEEQAARETHLANDMRKLREEFEAQKRDLQVQIDLARTEKQSIQASLKAQETEKEQLEECINLQQAQVKELIQKIKDHEAQTSQLAGQITSETSEKQQLSERIAAQEAEKQDLLVKIALHQVAKDQLANSITIQRAEIQEKTEAVEALAQSNAQLQEEFQKRVAALQQTIQDKNDKIALLEEQTATLAPWKDKAVQLAMGISQYEQDVEEQLAELSAALGTLDDDTQFSLKNLRGLPRLQALYRILIKRERDQKQRVEKLMDKIAVVSEELNKNSRQKACTKCGHTVEMNVMLAPPSSAGGGSSNDEKKKSGFFNRLSKSFKSEEQIPDMVISEPI